ncbi:Nucleotidyltransferase-like [Paenibacillus sophorae]|uniref:Nucleotidyltransferase-like n=1 Tax=Paenibacillus sophorae TaxID=1333845 RepID=A0A1H8SLF8_9BACL|nr:nucleotidyltransferase-like protein [Paenibacillus sophorae]QWU15467.1 hypothetical protein KP014_27045 [Paenibacillus sophorae]SEO79405.1 Nucleotidyltransferase-like [Paenibacillus sophorae]
MELSNLTLLNGDIFDANALGAIALDSQGKAPFQSALLHEFDRVVMLLHEDREENQLVGNMIAGELRTQTLRVGLSILQRSIITGGNNELITCLLEGDIIWDPQEVLEQLRAEVNSFEQPLRERILFIEFARFLHMYVKSKRYLQAGCIMDSYNCILMALYHWARMEVGEAGHYPTPAVWEQVKSLNNSVYKLYEELTISGETMDQRIQLVQLACEFSLVSKMGDCCKWFLDLLEERKGPWSIEELLELSELKYVEAELPFVLRKLASRSLIREIASWSDAGGGYRVRYTL